MAPTLDVVEVKSPVCQYPTAKFGLYSFSHGAHRAALIYLFHGQSQKETSVEDVEAQAPQEAEIEPTQEAYMAKVGCTLTV